jgi:hypothetical protein
VYQAIPTCQVGGGRDVASSGGPAVTVLGKWRRCAIAAILEEEQEPQRACERLVAEANERGVSWHILTRRGTDSAGEKPPTKSGSAKVPSSENNLIGRALLIRLRLCRVGSIRRQDWRDPWDVTSTAYSQK